jgi:hypothetical protein
MLRLVMLRLVAFFVARDGERRERRFAPDYRGDEDILLHGTAPSRQGVEVCETLPSSCKRDSIMTNLLENLL